MFSETIKSLSIRWKLNWKLITINASLTIPKGIPKWKRKNGYRYQMTAAHCRDQIGTGSWDHYWSGQNCATIWLLAAFHLEIVYIWPYWSEDTRWQLVLRSYSTREKAENDNRYGVGTFDGYKHVSFLIRSYIFLFPFNLVLLVRGRSIFFHSSFDKIPRISNDSTPIRSRKPPVQLTRFLNAMCPQYGIAKLIHSSRRTTPAKKNK